MAAANGGRSFLRVGSISGRGRHFGTLAFPPRTTWQRGHSRLTSIVQGKQKGNKGSIVRQKDQGYVDAVAPIVQAASGLLDEPY